MTRKQRALAGGTALALLAAGPAMAQEAAATPPADAPAPVALPYWEAAGAGTVSRFAADKLDAFGITSPRQLGAYVPNMVTTALPALGSAESHYLRGIGSTETLGNAQPGVLTSIDGIALSRADGSHFSFFDVDSITVARGPQGTAGGRNSSGGTIAVTMREPGKELSGFIAAGYGAYNRITGRAALNLPLAEGIGVQVAAYTQNDNGYAYNRVSGDRLNDDDGSGLRLAVRVEPGAQIKWVGAITYMLSRGENLVNFDCDPANPGDCSKRYATTGFAEARRTLDPLPVSGRKAELGLGNDSRTTVYASNLEVGGDALKLALITGLVERRARSALDLADGRDFPTLAVPDPAVRGAATGGYLRLDDGSSWQFSQEARLSGRLLDGRLSYHAGVFFLDETTRDDFADIATPAATPLALADRVAETGTRSLAGYGGVDLALTDRLTLAASVRYTDETRTLRLADNRAACAGSSSDACLDQANLSTPTRLTTRQWTPRVEARYRVGDDVLVFASATRGFRGGGWSLAGRSAASIAAYAPETLWSYEAGLRSEWLDKRLRVGITGFWIDADNLQASGSTVAGGLPLFATGSIGGYRNKGLELEAAALPIDGLNLFATLGWQDDDYRRGPAGAEPLRSPAVTAAAGASWIVHIPAAGIYLSPAARLSWRSGYATDVADSLVRARSLLLVNGGVTLTTDDDHWTLAVECFNCLDEFYTESSLGNFAYPGEPRRWQVRLKRAF